MVVPTFVVGLSSLTDTVFAGKARGVAWVGKKHDVTQSFIHTVITWLESDDGVRVVTLGDDKWTITLKKAS